MVQTLLERIANPAVDVPETVTPAALSNSIIEHGQAILSSGNENDDRVRMARRLTEVRPDMYKEAPPLPLPFGCPRNRCLISHFKQSETSAGCSRALDGAMKLRKFEHAHHLQMEQKQVEVFFSFTFLYMVLAAITLALVVRHFGKYHKRAHAQMELLRKVVQVVYSNPTIRESIETELKEDIGVVPPLPPHILTRMGGHGPSVGFFMCKSFKLAVLMIVLGLLFTDPFLAMPVLTVLMCMRCLQFSFCPPKPRTMMCSCCCCAATTEDVKNGTLTKDQECCTCCKGTGVCPVTCASCCGMDPTDACACCSEGCDCCSGDSPDDEEDDLKKPLLEAKIVEHKGESMQIV